MAALYALTDMGARSAYAALLAESPQRTPFSDLPFADAACIAFGLTGHLLLTERDAAEGGLTVFEKRAGPVRATALPPYGEFVTPVLQRPLRASAVHQHASALDAIAAALGSRFHQAQLRLHPSLVDVRPLTWAGWTLTPAFHMEASLTGDAGTGAWGRYPRKTVRRHADAYSVSEGRGQIPKVVSLAAQSLEAKGLRHPDVGACTTLAKALLDAGQARAFSASSMGSGDVEAGAVIVHADQTAYYWIVGSTPGPAMTVLLAHIAQEMRRDGIDRLHLGGANVPSVAEFKRSLGGELVPVMRARSIGPRWLRALHAIRNR